MLSSRRIRVCDLRPDKQERTKKHVETSGLDLKDFVQELKREFAISPNEKFVVVTTDRTILDFHKFEELQDDSTLYLLQHERQALPAATEEHITFTPHYDTLIRAGTYEYYASQGQEPLPYTLAELIDNALSATVKNKGRRTIEIRVLNDRTVGKPAIIVLDNGCGMTSKQLNNWAVYRLSKFTKESSTFASDKEVYVRPDHVPRSLNSDISYFGVGGKQAVFYIGDSVRMISKSGVSPDVHELLVSKEEFERKEKNKENVFRTFITHRKPGDFSHIKNNDERFLQALIDEERGKESFTAVVITGVQPKHITFLTESFDVVTRELAHTYHYYIHGVNGNIRDKSSSNSDDLKIDIHVTLQEKPPKCPRAVHLREVEDDMQTLYINAAADTFEFRASTATDNGRVEGIIRYHPFLYDKETNPKRPGASQEAPDNDDDDNESGFMDQARGERSIFECFWNGRLIPFTKVPEFDWCSPSKGGKVPVECYCRLSGVLFTDDRFHVTTNKLTFTDLDGKLKDKATIYTTVVNGQKSSKRANIQNEFTQWLQNCHEKFDKQVKFIGYQGLMTEEELHTTKMLNPCAIFSCIEWDGKTYKTGQHVKSLRTNPVFYGTIHRFLLHGNYDGDVFATGGQVEVIREPKALYSTTKIIPIAKIDKTATDEAIKKNIENDHAKLPQSLKVDWPEDNAWPQDAAFPAGTPLGPIKVEILNGKGHSVSSMPSVGQGKGPALNLQLTIVRHVQEPGGARGARGAADVPFGAIGRRKDEDIFSIVAKGRSKQGYHFTKIENLTQLGKYTLSVNTVMNDMNDTNEPVSGGKQLPSFTLKFIIKEGDAQSFVITTLSHSVRVGEPFNIPLQFKDLCDHLTAPPPNLLPILECSGLDVKYETVDSRGTTFTIKNVTVKGKILNYQQNKSYDLKVTLSGLQTDTDSVKIILHPGDPHSLHVMPEEDPVVVENGNPVQFSVEIHDEAGNITPNPRQMVHCEVVGLPPATVDCSKTGAGQLMTRPINLTIIDGQPQTRKVHFEIPSQRHVASVTRELKVIPSSRVALMQVYSAGDDKLVLGNNAKIDWVAGGVLENLFYRLYDEAGSEVTICAEIASRIKVNWTAATDLEDLIQGKLPDIWVPRRVKEVHDFQVSYLDQNVSVSFTITPYPDEPIRLQVTLPQSTVRLGEILPGNIILEPVDQHDNVTKTLNPTCERDMSVEAEGLDKSSVAFVWQECSRSVIVTGVRFSSGPLGSREMCFKYSTCVKTVNIEVTAGIPAKLNLISGPEQPLQLFSDHGISEPFLVQLCDEWGNPSPDKRVVVQLRSPTTLKVTASVMSQPVNAQGKASFTVKNVIGPKGCYELQFTGSFNKKPIDGPSVNLTIIPDPNKPVKLSAEYDRNAKFLAGGIFPVFSVTVVSEEGSPMTNFNPAAVSMFHWKQESSRETPPPSATKLMCSKPMEHEKNDRFYFRDEQIPERAGLHVIQFSLRDDQTKLLFSDQILINVVANQPVKLGPDSQPQTPVVSNSKDITSRTLVQNMTLRIMDAHGNPAGQDLNGRVAISIKCTNGDKSKSLPLFEGKTHSLWFDLVEGKVHIDRLAIMENSPGENGSTYILLFQPEVPKVPTPLNPFELQFHFNNDAENRAKMSALSKKKDELTVAISTHKGDHAKLKKQLDLVTSQHRKQCDEENSLRNELNRRNMTITQPASIQTIVTLINQKTAEVDKILKIPRRSCSIRENFVLQPDVLGMVGHLAFVEDDTAAWVISWFIGGYMDCIVTKTTEAATKIYRETQRRQKVMPLDSIYVTPGNRPLPHMRNGHELFSPPGNPVYARELLICPNDKECCDIVFKNILGDTIVIDDLQSANSYRRAVVQNKSPCPTILTRQGDKIDGKGMFGGAQNNAPPMQTLALFGAPLPPNYHTLRKDIEVLQQYQLAVRKRDEAEKERNYLSQNLQSPEMKKKNQEMEEKKKMLEDIERQLASTPVRPAKRGPEDAGDAGEPSGIITKRTRQRSSKRTL